MKPTSILEIPRGLSGNDLLDAINDRLRQIAATVATGGVAAASQTTLQQSRLAPVQTAPFSPGVPAAPILGAATLGYLGAVFTWNVPVTLQADPSRSSCLMQAQLYSDALHTTVAVPWYTVSPDISIAGSSVWEGGQYEIQFGARYFMLRAMSVSTSGVITFSNAIVGDVPGATEIIFTDLMLKLLGSAGQNVPPIFDLEDTRGGHTPREYQLRVGVLADAVFDLFDLTGGTTVWSFDPGTGKLALNKPIFLQGSNASTGAGSAALGANCPATTATAPYTWIKAYAPDGSTVYIPVWK